MTTVYVATSATPNTDVDGLGGGSGVSLPRYGALASRGAASDYPGALYYVTTGAAAGDVYESAQTGASTYAWKLLAYDRAAFLPGVTPWADWALDEASGTFASTGSQSGMGLAVDSGTPSREAGQASGRRGVWLPNARLAAAATAPSSTRRLTLSLWIEPSRYNANPSFALGYMSTAHASPYGTCGITFATSGNDATLRLFVTTSGAPTTHAPVTGSAGLVRTNRLHHVALVWDGDDGAATLKGYVDGRLDVQDNPTGGPDLEWLASSAWVLGNDYAGSSEATFGTYHRAVVLNGTALTQAQIREHFARTLGTYGGQ